MEIQAQVKAMKAANELQATANGLQQQMINEITTNNRVTSFHSKVMIALTAAIVFLGVITLLTNRNTPGRYAISGSTDGVGVFVLDTKTSQLWRRAKTIFGITYLGTNENPTDEGISRRRKLPTFEEDDPNE